MKLIMTAIAAMGAMTTFVGSAFADVSFTVRFGLSPSVNTYRTYDSYRSNIYQPIYQDRYYRYNHHDNDRYDNDRYDNDHSRVIIRQIVPNYNYGNSWNYSNMPNVNYSANYPATNRFIYNPYNSNLGDRYGNRYSVEKRYIRNR